MLGKAGKLPFTSYDVVVYFGVGISALPFLSRYVLEVSESKLPPLFSGYSNPLINDAVSIIALLFGVYVLGHGIAVLSSIFIEQFLYRSAGPPSRIIVEQCTAQPTQSFRSMILERIVSSYWKNSTASDYIRLVFHLPVIPLYLAMGIIRFHGFYECKISPQVSLRLQYRLTKHYDVGSNVLSGHGWFKIVEYACANDHPTAMAKMYNYLTIYGLFRSISFLLLCAIWAEFAFWFTRGGLGFIDATGPGTFYVRLSVVYGAYLISFIGFAKFSRRYTEEAVQAFSLSSVFKA
jgi:hypothetical protein